MDVMNGIIRQTIIYIIRYNMSFNVGLTAKICIRLEINEQNTPGEIVMTIKTLHHILSEVRARRQSHCTSGSVFAALSLHGITFSYLIREVDYDCGCASAFWACMPSSEYIHIHFFKCHE